MNYLFTNYFLIISNFLLKMSKSIYIIELMKRFLLILFFIEFHFFSSAQEVVKLTFAGDLMAHDINFRTEPLTDIYKGVSDTLLEDDLSFVNLEFPVDDDREQSSYPSFNVHSTYIEAAIDSGFDIFSLGNNHTNDFGLKSLQKTVANMKKFEREKMITYSGVFDDDFKFKTQTIQIGELKIGFIAVTQFNNNYWNKEGAKRVYKVDYKLEEESSDFLSYIESIDNDFDCLVLSYHGGEEYKPKPSLERLEFFDKLIIAGVDILWGHHPHVLQPWKLIEGENGDKLIMYSMGNFISGQLAIVDPVDHDLNFAATGFSALFKVELELVDGKLKIRKAEPDLIANVRNSNNFFVAVNKDDALTMEMNHDWSEFYKKMFSIAESRIRNN